MSIEQSVELVNAGLLELLNEMVRLDPEATAALIEARVPCNQAVVDHPTIVVWSETFDSQSMVGFLGVLNGWVSRNNKMITADYDDYGVLLGFTLRDKSELDAASASVEE